MKSNTGAKSKLNVLVAGVIIMMAVSAFANESADQMTTKATVQATKAKLQYVAQVLKAKNVEPVLQQQIVECAQELGVNNFPEVCRVADFNIAQLNLRFDIAQVEQSKPTCPFTQADVDSALQTAEQAQKAYDVAMQENAAYSDQQNLYIAEIDAQTKYLTLLNASFKCEAP